MIQPGTFCLYPSQSSHFHLRIWRGQGCDSARLCSFLFAPVSFLCSSQFFFLYCEYWLDNSDDVYLQCTFENCKKVLPFIWLSICPDVHIKASKQEHKVSFSLSPLQKGRVETLLMGQGPRKNNPAIGNDISRCPPTNQWPKQGHDIELQKPICIDGKFYRNPSVFCSPKLA